MIRNLQYNFKLLIGRLALLIGLLFAALAVFDQFEKDEEFSFVGEFFDEEDYDCIELPDSRSRNIDKISIKFQRSEQVKVFDQILAIFTPEAIVHNKIAWIDLLIFNYILVFNEHSIFTNAP